MPSPSRSSKNTLHNTGQYVGLFVFVLFLIFPLYWMFVTSFKDNSVLFQIPPEWVPSKPVMSHYVKLLSDNVFLIYYRNSLLVSGSTTLVTLLFAMFAGYGFSRFHFKFKNAIMFSLLSTQMLPVVSLLIALYAMYKSYGLLNTHLGLIIALTTASLPFSIWMIKVFFDNIPHSLEEAAKIDGCSRFGILFRIIFPLSKPGIFSVGIYTFILSWDDLLYSLTLINKDHLRTLNPGISIRYMGEVAYDWANIMTVCVTATIPIVILFLFFQKYMVAGLTAGAVKE
ncbi:carbohydrate ABC transporter permease [Paenibacillus sp. GCM10023248]|uniref:carbohydrate ABC transporter permease n=1 Tax=Bacillales TaxID=1385 RepID=UPI0023785193|nr:MULTISPECIES: carbohydrate ABC transporter permease [Bacillales]MDD9266297.1 carbohydrate ABC transporter permease [Paenibacillus sp. MAHUQ-63]MDR6878419.1 multiple sugar transport system permease protein [Bacillus sp. 3255]